MEYHCLEGKLRKIYANYVYEGPRSILYASNLEHIDLHTFKSIVSGVCQEFCVNHFSACHVIVFHEFRHTLIHQQLVANERPVWYPAP